MATMTAAEKLEKKRQALLQKKEALKKEAKAIQNLAYQARKRPATVDCSFSVSFLKRCSAPMGGCSIFQTLKPRTFLPVTVTGNGTPRHQYLSEKGRD